METQDWCILAFIAFAWLVVGTIVVGAMSALDAPDDET